MTPLKDPRLQPLTKRRITGAKIVLLADNFKVSSKVQFGEKEQRDYEKIHDLLKSGGSLEKYYRSGIDNSADPLLTTHCVMHLHLGGKNSDTLLYLVQFQDHVIELCIDSHVHVDDVPPGKKLPNGFLGKLAKQVEAAIAKVEQEVERETALVMQEKSGFKARLIASLDKLRKK